MASDNKVNKGDESDFKFNGRTKNLLENVFNSMNDELIVVDKDFIIREVNDYFLEQYGWKRDEIIGKFCYEILHEKERPCSEKDFKCPLKKVFNTGQPVHLKQSKKKQGASKSGSVYSAFPLLGEDGEVKYMVGLTRELTEFQYTDELLKDSEEQFRLLFNDSNVGIIFLDPAGFVIDINPKFLDILAFDREDVVKKNFFVLFSTLKMNSSDMLSTFDDNAHFDDEKNIEWKITNRKGEELFLQAHSSPILKNDIIIGRYVVVENITERKQTQRALSEYTEIIKVIFESVSDGMAISDLEGNIIEINEPGLALFGFESKDEIIGRNGLELLLEKDRSKAYQQLLKGRFRDSPLDSKYKAKSKNNGIFDLNISSTLIKDGEGNPLGFMVISKDTGKKEGNEKQLMDDKKRMELYLDQITHDVFNFNQSIITSSELLLNSDDLSELQKKYVKLTLDQAKAVSNYIFNTKKLAEVESGDLKVHNVDLYKMFSCALSRLYQSYSRRTIEINHQLKDSNITVKGNELLEHVFFNIFQNAVKFNRHDEVVIDIRHSPDRDGESLRIEIMDNGFGVPDIMKERIFDRFRTGKGDELSTGLGLTLSKEIINQCGGEIWIEDRVKKDFSQGSTLVIILPRGS
jgi:two-component system NtrC family sensor kinase